MKRTLLTLLLPALLAYLTIVAAFDLKQKQIIFVPQPLDHVTTPLKYHQPYEVVHFTAADGVTLNGWWVHHPGPPTHPALVYCHGNAAMLSLLANVTHIFYRYGFDALVFDYRSYGDSEKAPLSEAAVDADALAAYRWVQAKGYPESRIFIWGHSLGSSVAAQLSTRTHPAGLFLEGAFPSIYDVSRARFPWLLVFPFMIHDPFRTEDYVQERTCPLLEIHGEKDTVIPIKLGEEVYARAAEPKQWIQIPQIDHLDFPSVSEQYREPIMDFVARCLKKSH
ncbi:MAG TPA: alpha/beta hydrolase [bacterium]|nr:alpha/beta hydrolase [bacterium]